MWFWFNYFGRHGWLQVWTNSADVFQTTSGLDLKKIIGGLGQCSVNECDLFFFHTKIEACFEPPQVSKPFWKAFTELRLPIARRFLSMPIRSKKKKKSVRPEDEANTIYLFISLCHRILFPGLWNKHQKITFPPQLSVPDIGSHLLAEEPSMSSFSLWWKSESCPSGPWSQLTPVLQGISVCGWVRPRTALSGPQERVLLLFKPK